MIFEAIRPGGRVLRNYARSTGRTVTRCYSTRGLSAARRELTLHISPYRITLRAGWFWIEAEIRGFESPLHFSLNRPDTLFPFQSSLPERFGKDGMVAFAREGEDSSLAAAWLKDPENSAAVDALAIGPRDSLHVYENAIVFSGRASRNWPRCVKCLIAITRRLTPMEHPPGVELVDGAPFDVSRLPTDLQKLASYVRRWSVGDDVRRAERLERAATWELESLLREVTPMLPRINEYLDSFGDAGLPDEAVLIGRLAEAVDEVKSD